MKLEVAGGAGGCNEISGSKSLAGSTAKGAKRREGDEFF
jgi:hypothetical protein